MSDISVGQTARRGWRRMLAIWGPRVILIINWCQAASFAVLWLMLAWQDNLWLTDFTTFYSVGRMVLAGDGASLYDPVVLQRYEQATIAGLMDVNKAMLYLNPPYVSLLLAPLGFFSRPTAFLVWTALEIGLLVWAARLALAAARDWSRAERRLLLSAMLAFPPLLGTLLQGTFSLLLLVCLWQMYHGLRAGRPWLAGFWLGVGLLKPQIWLLLIVMLVVTRRWSALGGAGLVVGGLAVMSSLLLGWSTWPAWLTLIQGLTTQVVPSMYNFKALLGLWLGVERSGLITVLNWAAVIATTIGVGWLWRRPSPIAGRLFASRLALTITLGLLVTPYLYAHDSVLLVVPATLGYQVLRGRPAGRWYAALVVGSPLAFLLSNEPVIARLGIHWPVLLMGLLAGWLLVMSRGEVRSGPAAYPGGVGAGT